MSERGGLFRVGAWLGASALGLALALAVGPAPALAGEHHDLRLRDVVAVEPVEAESLVPLDADSMPTDGDVALAVQEDGAADDDAADGPGAVNMWRLYNPNSGEHFYTASDVEMRAVAAAGWWLEGIGWVAPTEGDPVYRLYNPYAGDHHYTMSEVERDHLVSAGWSYEGVGWASDPSHGMALLRQYNPYAWSGAHNYTASQTENDHLISVGWSAEGVGWWGLADDPLPVEPFWLQGANGDVAWVRADGSPAVGRFEQGGVTYYGREGSGLVVRGAWVTPDGRVVRAGADGALREGSLTGDGTLDAAIDWVIATQTGTGPDALRRTYDYVRHLSYLRQDHLGADWWNWSVFAAVQFWNNGQRGNCYRFAAFTYWIVRGLGYDDVSIVPGKVLLSYGLADHAWTEIRINGTPCIFDPEILTGDDEKWGFDMCLVPYSSSRISYYTMDDVLIG